MTEFEPMFEDKEPAKPEAVEPAEPVVTESQGDPAEPAVQAKPEGAPPAPEQRQVPLAALEAERTQRQDWKEKAVRLEEQLKALQERQAQPEPPAQQQGPASLEDALINERMNFSEMMVRQAHPDAEEKIAAFQEAVSKNPSLGAQLRAHPHPWDFAYQQGQRHLALKEIGDDPLAYRKRIEDELRASLAAPASAPVAAPAAPQIPQSLASARSSAARTAPAFSGPPSFEEIFK